MYCANCGTLRKAGMGDFCQVCGNNFLYPGWVDPSQSRLLAVHQDTETTPDKMGGCLSSTVVGWGCLLPMGTALIATGIGAIVGIPAAIAGAVAPFIGPFVFRRGSCPFCGERVTVLTFQKAHKCPKCKRTSFFKNNKLEASTL